MAKTVVTISVANSYLRIFNYPETFVKQVLTPFCAKYLAKFDNVPDPTNPFASVWAVTHWFATYNHARTELRITSALLKELTDHIVNRGFPYESIEIVDEPIITPKRAELEWAVDFKLKPDQVEWADYLLAEGQNKLSNGMTGIGKTALAIYVAVTLGQRVTVMLNARFVPIWIVECAQLLKLKPEDFIVVEAGGLDLYIKWLKEGKINPKIMVVSLTKADLLTKKAKKDPTVPNLDDYYRIYAPGVRCYDEAHESIHQVYLSMMFGNVAKNIGNTATIKNEDAFINRIYEYLFPKNIRLKETEYSAHMHIKAIHYDINLQRHRVNTHSRGTYNDNTFEASIMNNKKLRMEYIELMLFCFKEYYYERRKPGTKCLFFFTRVETCKIMCAALKERYPDFDAISFTGEEGGKKETKEEYRKHEMVFSTPGSCGTGKDIPGLITCISFHNVRSIQRNYQMRGRIRPIKEFPELERIFGYTVCRQIPKHKEYHKHRRGLFEESSLSYQLVDSGVYMY